jgi:hypothetical protein
MPLPSSGQIAFSQLAAELGNACSNVSLRSYSACANLTSPDSIIELRGKSCIPVFGAGAWSSGGVTITSRQGLTGFGTQNEALATGGRNPYTNDLTTNTEEYNGTSWSAGGALITGRYTLAGAGTQNAGLAMGGYAICVVVCYDEFDEPYNSYTAYEATCTEEYNGTSWSAGGALITGRYYLAGAGTQNAGLAFGGYKFTPSSLSCTEEYNGTSWSTGGALITDRRLPAGAGTQNEGLSFGGGGSCTNTEEYNGTSWSTGGALATGRNSLGGAGTQNEGLAMGGRKIYVNVLLTCTEEYNGTSWSTGGTLIIGREGAAGAGTQNAGLAVGAQTCTEEYNGTSWSTGGALIAGRSLLAGAGTQGAGLVVGGVGSGFDGRRTDEYNKSITGKCLG